MIEFSVSIYQYAVPYSYKMFDLNIITEVKCLISNKSFFIVSSHPFRRAESRIEKLRRRLQSLNIYEDKKVIEKQNINIKSDKYQ